MKPAVFGTQPTSQASGADLAWGCPELPPACPGSSAACCPSGVLFPPLPPTEGRTPASGVQGRNLWGVPGIWALPGPQFWGQASPLHVVPCSNGILYQYPDRTDVTPLLSVNMG